MFCKFLSSWLLADSLRGDYLAAPKTSAKEKRIKELADRILKNEKSVVEEVIKQMNVMQVNKLVNILSAEDPDDVSEILTRVKNSLH